jgi:tRNA dimethylallyltransferase
MEKPRVVIVLGPTGVGKSELALEVAERFGLEVACADSMQVYRGMDVGSDKPTRAQRERVPHHLVDVLDPDEEFGAAQFKEKAREVIFRLHREGKRVVVVGGTGLYVKVLTQGLFPCSQADATFRKTMWDRAERFGRWLLFEDLQKVDPEAAHRLHRNDTFRIIRALEVYHLTRKPISVHQREHRFRESPFEVLKVGLERPRGELYDRIEKRVDEMLRKGLVEEVQSLLAKGYLAAQKPFHSLGYRQIVAYLKDVISLDEAVRLIKRDTKRYAKRQATWFKRDEEIVWFPYPSGKGLLLRRIKNFLKI